MPCAKFSGNWISGSGKEFFFILSMFHNATCGSIQLKQDKVTTAQYCILKVKKKKRKFTNMNAHTDSHTF